MPARGLSTALALLLCAVTPAKILRTASTYTDGKSPGNKFGMGVYGKVPWEEQLSWTLNLTGHGGRVLLYMTLSFSENGDVTSCGGCKPAAEEIATLQHAYTMGLRPVVRIGQYPRTIRDFSDDNTLGVHVSCQGLPNLRSSATTATH